MHNDIHNQGYLYIITNSQKKNPKRITEKRDLKESLSFSNILIAFDYQKVTNHYQVFTLSVAPIKKRGKGDTVGHKKPLSDGFCVTAVVLHSSQMCYTMNNRVRTVFNRRKQASEVTCAAVEIVVCLGRERFYFSIGIFLNTTQWKDGMVVNLLCPFDVEVLGYPNVQNSKMHLRYT